jgi:hypothetical protein
MHGMSEQYIFRFEIAMYDFVAMEEHQASEELLRKAPNELQRKALEVVSLDELVQVHAEQVS